MTARDDKSHAAVMFSLTRSIIYDCPAIVIDDSLVKIGKAARIVVLKGATQEDAALIVNALRATRCKDSGHVWVGTGDEKVVCDDCGIERASTLSHVAEKPFDYSILSATELASVPSTTPRSGETPRTDEEICSGFVPGFDYVEADFARQLERELAEAMNRCDEALEAAEAAVRQRDSVASATAWKSWTENPPMVKEPAVYAVLVDCGDGSLEAKNNLTMALATWGPELQHGGGSNWPDTWGCGWNVRHINYWFPVELGESCKRLRAADGGKATNG